jgi:hypothetical protein
MKIFTALKEEEECFQINYPLVGKRLEPKGVPLNQSGVTTNPWGEVTFNHISSKYFKYLRGFQLWRQYWRQFWG